MTDFSRFKTMQLWILLGVVGVVAFLCFLSMLRVLRLEDRFGPGLSLIMPRIMGLVLRHLVGIQRTLAESPTRFKPLLYLPDEKARASERTPPEGNAAGTRTVDSSPTPKGSHVPWNGRVLANV